MRTSSEAPDAFLAMDEFAKDARSLDSETFAQQHGRAFLVRSLEEAEPEPERRVGHATIALGIPMLHPDDDPLIEGAALFAVYPVRWRTIERASGITVGRSPDADICIGDMSLDDEHAHLILTSDGGFAVVDDNSTGGTFIEGERVEAGAPRQIPAGKTLQFGNVRLTFLPTAWFIEFVIANVAPTTR